MDTEAIPLTPVEFDSQREPKLDCMEDPVMDQAFGLLRQKEKKAPVKRTTLN